MRARLTPLLLVVLLAASGTAAHAADGPYPPSPPPDADPEITVTTPRATIEIFGSNWGPRTQVVITHDDNSGTGTSSQSDGDTAAASGSGERTTLGRAETDEDGTFELETQAPEGAEEGDTFRVVASGVDVEGEQASAGTAVEFLPPERFTPASDAGGGGVPRGVLVLAALLVAGGTVLGRRRWARTDGNTE